MTECKDINSRKRRAPHPPAPRISCVTVVLVTWFVWASFIISVTWAHLYWLGNSVRPWPTCPAEVFQKQEGYLKLYNACRTKNTVNFVQVQWIFEVKSLLFNFYTGKLRNVPTVKGPPVGTEWVCVEAEHAPSFLVLCALLLVSPSDCAGPPDTWTTWSIWYRTT